MNENPARMRLVGTFAWLAGHGVAALVVLHCLLNAPRFIEIFKDFDAELPSSTMLLIAVSDVACRYWWMMFAAALVADGGILFGLHSLPRGARCLTTVWGVFGLVAAFVLVSEIYEALFLPIILLLEKLT